MTLVTSIDQSNGLRSDMHAHDGPNVAIVGGGVLGMYLSWRLSDAGINVTLIESAARTGGLASPSRIGTVEWDRFYHVILMSDTNLIGMLRELGLESELRWGITKTGFYTDDNLVSMSNALEFLRFPPLNIVDKLRLGATIFYASRIRNWKSLEAILAVDWLKKWSGRRVLEKIWLPLLKSKLGENYKVASAAFIWAIIARMYAARRADLKQEKFGYVQGGYATILGGLQKRLDDVGVMTRYDATVKEVSGATNGVSITTEEGITQHFDHAIMTVSSDLVANMCVQLTHAEKNRLRNITYQGIICTSFLLKSPLSQFYVTNITDSSIPVTGIIEMTTLVDPDNFGGNSLVYIPQYLTQSSEYWAKTDEEVYEDCISALERMYPEFDRTQVISRKIARARTVLAISTLEYSNRLRPAINTSLSNVSIVNSAQISNGTLNVNETLGVVDDNFELLLAKLRQTTEISN